MRTILSTATIIAALTFVGVTHAEEQHWWDLRDRVPGDAGVRRIKAVVAGGPADVETAGQA